MNYFPASLRWLILACGVSILVRKAIAEEIFIRINQLGYQVNGSKIALAFSRRPLPAELHLTSETNEANR